MGGFDMNVRDAWLMGYAGRNVSVSILDDGLLLDNLTSLCDFTEDPSTPSWSIYPLKHALS